MRLCNIGYRHDFCCGILVASYLDVSTLKLNAGKLKLDVSRIAETQVMRY